eukprot:2950166-Rhodomonas_salina.1
MGLCAALLWCVVLGSGLVWSGLGQARCHDKLNTMQPLLKIIDRRIFIRGLRPPLPPAPFFSFSHVA